jgi:site-specific recombinase XerD
MAEPAPDRVRVSGPLAAFADGFLVDLVEQGYRQWPAQKHLYFLASVSRWMETEDVGVAELTPGAVERFVADPQRAAYRNRLCSKSLRPLLAYLGGLGALPAGDGEPLTPVEQLLAEYRDYLLVERALTPGSVELYEPVARLFLEERSAPISEDLARLSGREIHAFVLREARQRGQRSAETMVAALRSLLRFLHVQGWIATPLATAVPSVRRRREGLPRGLAAGQVRLLLESCDRESPAGRRDFAILMLLARLGLRRAEVAALALDDVDWRAGEIVIRGKGPRIDRLPLPGDVGEALVDYLRDGRPRGFGRRLVLPARAPYDELSPGAVTAVVMRACKRAGIAPVGAQRLRHTIASELLRRGAPLSEIGQLLRHQSIDTTAIYAKVDHRVLSRLALAWPGSES